MDMTLLGKLSELLHRRNEIDARIATLIGRPAERGHVGEVIAAEILNIGLAPTATEEGNDGAFNSGPLAEVAKDLSDAARAEVRAQQARPLLEEFRAWLALAETQSLPKSPLGKAITYARNQWPSAA